MIQELMIKKIFNIVFFSYIFRFFIDQNILIKYFLLQTKKKKKYTMVFFQIKEK
jgi:hypothetical protein